MSINRAQLSSRQYWGIVVLLGVITAILSIWILSRGPHSGAQGFAPLDRSEPGVGFEVVVGVDSAEVLDAEPREDHRKSSSDQDITRGSLTVVLATIDGTPLGSGEAELHWWLGESLLAPNRVDKLSLVDGRTTLEAPLDQPFTLKLLRFDGADYVPNDIMQSPMDGEVKLTVVPLTGVAFVTCTDDGRPLPATVVSSRLVDAARVGLNRRDLPFEHPLPREQSAQVTALGHFVNVSSIAASGVHEAVLVSCESGELHTIPVRSFVAGIEPSVGVPTVEWEIVIEPQSGAPFRSYQILIESEDGNYDSVYSVHGSPAVLRLRGVPPQPTAITARGISLSANALEGKQSTGVAREDLSTGQKWYRTVVELPAPSELAVLKVELVPPSSGFHEQHVSVDPVTLGPVPYQASLVPIGSNGELADHVIPTHLSQLRVGDDGRFRGAFAGLLHGRYELRVWDIGLVMQISVADDVVNEVVELGDRCHVELQIVDADSGERLAALVGCDVAPSEESASRRLGGARLRRAKSGVLEVMNYGGNARMQAFHEGYTAAQISASLAYASETVIVEMHKCPKLTIRVHSDLVVGEASEESLQVDARYTGGSFAGRGCILRFQNLIEDGSFIEFRYDADIEGTIELDVSVPSTGFGRTAPGIELAGGVESRIELCPLREE